MQLRALTRQDGKWVIAFPKDIIRWMNKVDGEDALIIDDSTEQKTYFCANENLLAECRNAGKAAEMFYPLMKRLWEEREAKGNVQGKAGSC